MNLINDLIIIEPDDNIRDLLTITSNSIEIWCTVCGKNGEHVRKWISVKERLPEELITVLIFVVKWDSVEYAKIKEYSYFDKTTEKRWVADSCCDYPQWSLDEVTHWMPLPEPPKD